MSSTEMEVFHVVMVISIAAIAYIIGRMDGNLSASKRITKVWEDSLASTIKSYDESKTGIEKGFRKWDLSGQFEDVDYAKPDNENNKEKGRPEDGKNGPK